MNAPDRNATPRLVVGLCVMAMGVLLTLRQMGVVEHAWRYWPLTLVALGLARLFESPRAWRDASGYVWIAAGSALLLDQLRIIDIWRFFWPAVLILAGVSLLRVGSRPALPDDDSGGGTIHHTAFLGGGARHVVSDDFRGGDCTAVLGGIELDLRAASIREGVVAELDVLAVWGGLELKIPANWQVDNRVTAILGGNSDRTQINTDSSQRLVLRGLVMMGGIDVKN